jgi:hypothetical protein
MTGFGRTTVVDGMSAVDGTQSGAGPAQGFIIKSVDRVFPARANVGLVRVRRQGPASQHALARTR